MKKLIISSVGTSLFTNIASEKRELIYNNSNCKGEECPPELISLIHELKKNIKSKLSELTDISTIRRMSAELNGLFGFNEKYPIEKQDIHYLITTDTYQGKECGEILADFLNTKNINTQIHTPNSLTTRTKYDFDEGIKDLIAWCDKNIPGYKTDGYEIIFNLTGSFKSFQGYMNTIAMFYADKIIYIFESTKAELIEIPKLPLEIDSSMYEKYVDKLLLLANKAVLNKNDVEGLPELMFDVVDNKIAYSVWGELVWKKIKDNLLKRELPELPYIKYSDEVKKLYNKATDKDKVQFLETLGKVSSLLMDKNGDITVLKRDGGLKYENYQNKFDNNDLPIGHFRITQSERVSCTYRNKQLFVRKFGRHDFVNDNP